MLPDGSCTPATPDRAKTLLKQVRSEASKLRKARCREKAEQLQCEIEDRRAAHRLLRELAESDRDQVRMDAVLHAKVITDAAPRRTSSVRKRGAVRSASDAESPSSRSSWVIDDRGMRGVHYHQSYLGRSSPNFYPGAARDHWLYVARDEAVMRDGYGDPIIISNVGGDVDEIAAAWECIEAATVRKNGKVQIRIIVPFDADASKEEQVAVLRLFCETVLKPLRLPYAAAPHEPSPEGDQRNPHGHILVNLRPTRRIAPYTWAFADDVRGEIDGKNGVQMLRHLWAHSMSEAAESFGRNIRYTGLGYGARGLDLEPGVHLGEALTAQVRRGETVWAHERNRIKTERNCQRRIMRDLDKKIAALMTLREALITRQAAAVAPTRPGLIKVGSVRPTSPLYPPHQARARRSPLVTASRSTPTSRHLVPASGRWKGITPLIAAQPTRGSSAGTRHSFVPAATVRTLPHQIRLPASRPFAPHTRLAAAAPPTCVAPLMPTTAPRGPEPLAKARHDVARAGTSLPERLVPAAPHPANRRLVGPAPGQPWDGVPLQPTGRTESRRARTLPIATRAEDDPIFSRERLRAVVMAPPEPEQLQAAATAAKQRKPPLVVMRVPPSAPNPFARLLEALRLARDRGRRASQKEHRAPPTDPVAPEPTDQSHYQSWTDGPAGGMAMPQPPEAPTLAGVGRIVADPSLAKAPVDELTADDVLLLKQILHTDMYVGRATDSTYRLSPANLDMLIVDESWLQKAPVRRTLGRVREGQQQYIARLSATATGSTDPDWVTKVKLEPRDAMQIARWKDDPLFKAEQAMRPHPPILSAKPDKSTPSPNRSLRPETAAARDNSPPTKVPDGFGGWRTSPPPIFVPQQTEFQLRPFDPRTGKPTPQLLMLARFAANNSKLIDRASDGRLMALPGASSVAVDLLVQWRGDKRVDDLITRTVTESRANGRPTWPQELAIEIRARSTEGKSRLRLDESERPSP